MNNRGPINKLFSSAILLFISFCFIFMGVIFNKLMIGQSKDCTERTIGEVVDYITDSEGYYKSIYEYSIDGITYNVTSSVSTSYSPTIGKVVTIYYSPTDHNNFYEEGDMLITKIICKSLTYVGIFMLVCTVMNFIVLVVKGLILGSLVIHGLNTQQISQDNQVNQNNQYGFNNQNYVNNTSETTEFTQKTYKPFDEQVQTYPCPYCGNLIKSGENPCPSCNNFVQWPNQ